jgi:SAM-dependent methyltransferase
MSDPLSKAHAANRLHWESQAVRWEALRDEDGGWRRCAERPELGLPGPMLALIERHLGSLEGSTACVLASGDNYSTFALAGLGAHVVSVDQAQAQLDIARRRAEEMSLAGIDFVRSDACRLPAEWTDRFDLVCHTNGVMVWMADPARFYAEASRILRPNGLFLSRDIHPFQRPWADKTALRIDKPYGDRGPYGEPPDPVEHHWTMADLINGALTSGLRLARIVEERAGDAAFWHGYSYRDDPDLDPTLTDWRRNPRAGLPAWLTLAATKPPQNS